MIARANQDGLIHVTSSPQKEGGKEKRMGRREGREDKEEIGVDLFSKM